MPTFLSTNSWISPRGIDEADYWQFEFGRQLHFLHCLTIAFRMSTAKETFGSLFHRATFLMSDDHYLLIIQLGKAGKHRTVVTELAISMKFYKFVKH